MSGRERIPRSLVCWQKVAELVRKSGARFCVATSEEKMDNFRLLPSADLPSPFSHLLHCSAFTQWFAPLQSYRASQPNVQIGSSEWRTDWKLLERGKKKERERWLEKRSWMFVCAGKNCLKWLPVERGNDWKDLLSEVGRGTYFCL